MSYVHLRDRKYYEDIYDRHTVEDGRRGMGHYAEFYDELEKKLPKDDTIDRPGNAALLNMFCMQVVGNDLLYRYENREQYINERMAEDEAKDNQIATARLSEEPYCHHCGKQGLRITDKSLMHRKENARYDDPEDVLFMLHCPHCDKNSAFWEDGTAWKPKLTLCPRCKAETTRKITTTKTAITFTYSCPSCGYSYKDKMDLKDKKKKVQPDPDYDKDRIHFCLIDKEFRDKLYAIKGGFERMAEFGKKYKEKEDNKHIYDAVAELKQPKIAELPDLLIPALEKAGYTEFSLDKPEMGRDVFIGFNCLDSKTDRGDYDSRNTLRKLVIKALKGTNWRLTTDGISYRLGYLNGRLHAYEREEDLKKLVMQEQKLKNKSKVKDDPDNAWRMKTPDGKEIIY